MDSRHVTNGHFFPLDEPPTLPGRTPSGGVIKAPIIRGMAAVHTAAKEANAALDRLIEMCRMLPPASSKKASTSR